MTRTNHRTDPAPTGDLSESADMGRGQKKREQYNLMGIDEMRERRAYSEAGKLNVGDTFDEVLKPMTQKSSILSSSLGGLEQERN